MYKCGECKKTQPEGTKRINFIAQTRPKTYENRISKGKREKVIRSSGWEIVKEIALCTPCSQAKTKV